MSGAPDTVIEYDDKGKDTSVAAPARLTGMGNASPLNDLPTGSTSDLPPGLTPGGDRKLQSQLRSAYVEKQANDESAIDNTLLKQDRARIKQQYDATAVMPGEFPKWNAEEQATKYRTDPLSAFGSLGSVAGMIASAFTHHPMQNAMEASAAAMNAIHAGDQKAYDQAHEAWKQNLDLAIKRHEIEQQRFGDAMKLMDTDIRLGEAQLRNNAIRFGNKQELAMLDAGMLPQLVETRAKMADTYLKLQAVRDDMEQHGISGAVADRLQKQVDQQYPEGSQERVGAMYQVSRIRHMLNDKDFNVQEYGQWAAEFFSKEHRFPTGDEINDHTAELARAKRGGTTGDQQRSDAIAAERERLIRDENVDPLVAQGMAVAKYPPGHSGVGASGTKPGSLADDRTKLDAAITAKHPNWSPEQVIAERNRQLKQGKIDQAIINQLEHYPGMDRSDLGDINKDRQTKLMSAFESATNLEAIAKYVKENPDAVGYFAKVSNKLNLDSYQSLVQKADKGGDEGKAALQDLQSQASSDFDKTAGKQLTLTQAAKAKVLNKMLTTQAFADAAASGAKGGTIFLDKVFKELYDQGSSPGAFYSILEKRYDEANHIAEEYKLGFDHRNDKESMPFWTGKAAGYAGKSVSDKPPVEGARLAKDGNWYVPDPNRPGKYLKVQQQ